MNKRKYLFQFLMIGIFAFGAVLFAPNVTRAQSSLWSPNPFNSWMANRYHRGAKTSRAKNARAGRNPAAVSRRRHIRSRRRR